MRKNVPGIHIPDSVIERMKGASDQTREGLNLCVDLIQEVRTIKGVSGVHVMAYRQEEAVAEVIDRSGILAGRTPWFPGRDQQINEDRKLS
jgi:methylenetetrahydrofolate reductase (NADPH)